jgi:hypothetical protein
LDLTFEIKKDVKDIDNHMFEIAFQKIEERKMSVIATHVQFDELSATPDLSRRTRLLRIYQFLVKEVPTSGAVWGVSKWGQAKYGTDQQNDDLVLLKANNDKNIEDALISITAAENVEIFVTAETTGGLKKRIERSSLNITVWNWTNLRSWLLESD